MYNISEIIDAILCLTVTYKLIQTLPYIYETVKTGCFFLNDVLDCISENNPLLIDYDDILNEENEETCVLKSDIEVVQKIEPKYEDKYLEKFKRFPNEFQFSEVELEEEKKEFENIKTTSETNKIKSINKIKEQLGKIYDIENGDNLTSELNENVTENINTLCKNGLIHFFNLEDEEPDDIDFEQLFIDLIEKRNELKTELKCIEDTILEDDDMIKAAREIIVTRKLDKLIDNYILEHTPLGNIYMRYNNSKQSFEYFSNSTMPYRYLEPVGRKYVITYWCKPLFIDIEEELKKSEQKNEEERKRKEDDNKRIAEEFTKGIGTKDVIAKLKNYNKDTKNQSNMKPQMKNRSGSNFALPPQITANLPNVNQPNEKHLLKENANRYTCEGRLTGFSPLKKIDKKISDKNLSMSYADFKRIQKEEQNKK